MAKAPKSKNRFLELMARYCELGRLLPSTDDVEDGQRLDEAKIILAEMRKVQAEMDAISAARKAKN